MATCSLPTAGGRTTFDTRTRQPTVVIVAPANDLHALAVIDHLNQLRVPSAHVDISAIEHGARVTQRLRDHSHFQTTIVTDDGVRVSLSDVETIWWRRPLAPRSDDGLDERGRHFVRAEWDFFLAAMGCGTSCRWVNPPLSTRQAEIKAWQLRLASECGLRIPDTAFTNDPDAVCSLAQSHSALIYKRLSPVTRPSTCTRKMHSRDFERLDVLPACPAVFQEYIAARVDIRVTAIGPQLHAVEIDSQSGSAPTDWRLDQSVAFSTHDLDPEVSLLLQKLLKELDLRYAAIDLRLTPDGEYVFLEVNPSGQYLFVELLTGAPLSKAMALFLAGSERD